MVFSYAYAFYSLRLRILLATLTPSLKGTTFPFDPSFKATNVFRPTGTSVLRLLLTKLTPSF